MEIFLDRFLGIQSFSPEAKSFIMQATLYNIFFNFLIMSVNTFFVFYALTIISYQGVAELIGIQFIIAAIFNIPTGALSDKFGERWVFVISSVLFGLSSILLIESTSFLSLVLCFSLLSIADSSKSGSFISWFSNNYKYQVKEDSTFQVFPEILGKYGMLNMISISLSFSIGAIVISILTLKYAFYLQGISIIIFGYFLYFHYKNHPMLEHVKRKKNKGALQILYNGFKFTLNDKSFRFLLLGIIITGGVLQFWFKFLSFTMYDIFGKSDAWIGNLRTGEFLIGSLLTGFAGVVAGKVINVKKWLSITYIFAYSIFFWGFYILLSIIGIPQYFSISGVFYYLLTYSISALPFYVQTTLQYRFFIDLIPDENRNSINSIIPTFNLLFGGIITFLGAILISKFSLTDVFLIVGFIGLLGGLISFYSVKRYKPTINTQKTLGKYIFYSPFLGSNIINIKNIVDYSKLADTTESHDIIKNIGNTLIEIAFNDFSISETEQQLLNVILSDIQAYVVFLDSLKGNTNFDKEEIIQFVEDYKKKIYLNAMQIAIKDNIIGPEEMQILFLLQQIMEKWTIFDIKVILKKCGKKF